LGVLLFIAEIKIASFGFLTVGGILCLFLGSIMLFEDQGSYLVRVSWGIIVPTVVAVTLFFTVVIALVVKAQVKKPTTGAQGLVGERGVVRQRVTPGGGKVFVHGEYWNAVGDEVIEEGVSVEVVELDQLKLVVRRVSPSTR
jgi:membrane-bound serine protease (ClpP class)